MFGRKKFILVGVGVAIAVLLVPPALSWTAIEASDDPMLTISATAYCAAYRTKGTFVMDYEVGVEEKPSFVSYVGDWWADAFSSGAVIPGYPCVAILFQRGDDLSTRQEWFAKYTYGDTYEWSESFPVSDGEFIRFQIQIYFAQSVSTADSDGITIVQLPGGDWTYTKQY